MTLVAKKVGPDDWEQLFRAWAKPPTSTEQSRCDNAVSVVRNAIQRSDALVDRDVKVFAQGSYRNNTNVRTESDVDICVCCYDTFFFELPPGLAHSSAGILTPASYTIEQFRTDVVAALKNHLGSGAVTPGNKCIDLHENTYRVDADVVPAFEHRRYYLRGLEGFDFHSGTELRPLSGGRIVNWPAHNYRNGTDKNQATGNRFKKIVRILKRLKIEMEAGGIASTKAIPSYLVECLVWQAPEDCFGHDLYLDDVRAVLVHLFEGTKLFGGSDDWTEPNGLKGLFRSGQPWSRTDANRFVVDAWNYVGVFG